MTFLKQTILILLSIWCNITIAQESAQHNLEWVNESISRLYTDEEMNSQEKSDLADSAFSIAAMHNDICSQITLRVLQATSLDNMGLADSALAHLFWSRRAYDKRCDSLLLMSLYRNLTNVYISLNELAQVDSISKIALQTWNHSWPDKDSRLAIINNLAISRAMSGNMESATELFHQAYREARDAEDEEYIQKELINLGSLKGMMEDHDSAYYFFALAAEKAKTSADIDNFMPLLVNLADLERHRGNHGRGIILLDSAFAMAEKNKSTEMLASVQKTRADLYASLNNYEKAYGYLTDYLSMREQYLDEEKVKAVTEMMEKYESEKKARQIQQLEVDKLDAELKNERVTNTRNRYLYIGAGVLLIAIALWTRLMYVRRSRTAIQREKDISEGLLLNILPAEVAQELKTKGFAEARHFSPVTILFSDFKGFTIISEELSATEIVEELNACFKAFDEIMTKYGIEKIKTIGDSYMAAGNIPETNTSTPVDVVNAGLDMQEFVIARKKERDARGLLAFDMRVGIHSGPVVAGIVGVKKFQYDLWGDTVNMASRMESHGEIGQVNISETTYELVNENPSFLFNPRGKMLVKGKADQVMYFVQRA